MNTNSTQKIGDGLPSTYASWHNSNEKRYQELLKKYNEKLKMELEN